MAVSKFNKGHAMFKYLSDWMQLCSQKWATLNKVNCQIIHYASKVTTTETHIASCQESTIELLCKSRYRSSHPEVFLEKGVLKI